MPLYRRLPWRRWQRLRRGCAAPIHRFQHEHHVTTARRRFCCRRARGDAVFRAASHRAELVARPARRASSARPRRGRGRLGTRRPRRRLASASAARVGRVALRSVLHPRGHDDRRAHAGCPLRPPGHEARRRRNIRRTIGRRGMVSGTGAGAGAAPTRYRDRRHADLRRRRHRSPAALVRHRICNYSSWSGSAPGRSAKRRSVRARPRSKGLTPPGRLARSCPSRISMCRRSSARTAVAHRSSGAA